MVPSRVQHRQSIDLARFIAAFGVVAAHVFAAENGWIGHLALAAFLILTAFLSVQSMQRAGGGVYDWGRRAPRILVPWVFWCVVYKVVLVQVTDGPDKYALLTDPFSLLVGPFIHLWFLPFVLLASAFVAPVARMVQSARGVQAGSVVLAVLGFACFWGSGPLAMMPPLPQWLSAVPSFGYGLLAALAMTYGARVWPLAAMALLCGISFVLTQGIWTVQPLIAAVLFWVVWDVPMRARILPHLGQVAFGIYLTHPFFLLVCFKVLGAQMNHLVALVLTFLMSWVATIGLRAVPFLRRMV
jgi:peptidoglycan/LPS O-acetylase OafA/YrhL